MDCVDYECTGMDEPDAIGRPGEEDDCDEFEREMLAELDERVHRAEQDGGLRAGGSALLPSTTTTSRQNLLDSDDEEDDDGDERLPQPSNDELLFDPGADNEDQKWADKVRRSHHPKAASGVVKAPNSSAVLSCPACFIVVCIDCQQHWEYKHQFRAMFVMNCQVDTSSSLKFPLSKKEQRKQAHLKKKKREQRRCSNFDG